MSQKDTQIESIHSALRELFPLPDSATSALRSTDTSLNDLLASGDILPYDSIAQAASIVSVGAEEDVVKQAFVSFDRFAVQEDGSVKVLATARKEHVVLLVNVPEGYTESQVKELFANARGLGDKPCPLPTHVQLKEDGRGQVWWAYYNSEEESRVGCGIIKRSEVEWGPLKARLKDNTPRHQYPYGHGHHNHYINDPYNHNNSHGRNRNNNYNNSNANNANNMYYSAHAPGGYYHPTYGGVAPTLYPMELMGMPYMVPPPYYGYGMEYAYPPPPYLANGVGVGYGGNNNPGGRGGRGGRGGGYRSPNGGYGHGGRGNGSPRRHGMGMGMGMVPALDPAAMAMAMGGAYVYTGPIPAFGVEAAGMMGVGMGVGGAAGGEEGDGDVGPAGVDADDGNHPDVSADKDRAPTLTLPSEVAMASQEGEVSPLSDGMGAAEASHPVVYEKALAAESDAAAEEDKKSPSAKLASAGGAVRGRSSNTAANTKTAGTTREKKDRERGPGDSRGRKDKTAATSGNTGGEKKARSPPPIKINMEVDFPTLGGSSANTSSVTPSPNVKVSTVSSWASTVKKAPVEGSAQAAPAAAPAPASHVSAPATATAAAAAANANASAAKGAKSRKPDAPQSQSRAASQPAAQGKSTPSPTADEAPAAPAKAQEEAKLTFGAFEAVSLEKAEAVASVHTASAPSASHSTSAGVEESTGGKKSFIEALKAKK